MNRANSRIRWWWIR